MLDDPLVDVIYNPLPNALHHEWTLKALGAGKHVLLEKPSAHRADETRMMFGEARRRGVVLLEGMHYRFHPALTHAKSLLSSGSLGRIKHMDVRMRLPRGMFGEGDIRYVYSLGGGAMMDLGCYAMNVLLYFAGTSPVCVTSATADVFVPRSRSPDMDAGLVDAGMHATLLFPNSVTASLTTHLGAPPRLGFVPIVPEMSVVVTGEEGEMELFNHVMPSVYHSISVTRFEGGKREGKRVERVYKPKEGRGEEWWSTYRYQLEAFVDRVRGREPACWVTPEDSVNTMEWVERVYEKSGLGARPASNFKLADQ
ncbi:NAD(P)-binding protein [Trametopsis cervina]|nr:NAD(P)-binding protein [Trametopsis cervina]